MSPVSRDSLISIRLVGVLALAVAALAMFFAAPSAHAQALLSKPPADLEAADIVEHRGDSIALDAVFTDQNGNTVKIGDCFDGKHPVVLVLGYFTCPVVCPVVFNNTQKVFNDLAWKLGKEYRAVTVSFDYTDTSEMAKDEQSTILGGVTRHTDDDAWPFLTGSADQIQKLCDSVGWKIKRIAKTGDYSHPTGLVVLSPTGEISNYLYGVSYKQRQLRLALVAASDGTVGDVFDKILLRCYHYDPDAGGYVLAASRVMTYSGIATMALLGGTIGMLVLWDHRRARRANARANADALSTSLTSDESQA